MPLSAMSRAAVATALALSVTACAGGDGGAVGAPSTSSVSDTPATVAVTQLDPAAFAEAVADTGTYTLNVHVPDEGSIAGTTNAIPFDEIGERADELPQDRGTRLAVYCKTGRMSAEAVVELQALGYTDLVELRGGMDAWVADGRDLVPAAD